MKPKNYNNDERIFISDLQKVLAVSGSSAFDSAGMQ